MNWFKKHFGSRTKTAESLGKAAAAAQTLQELDPLRFAHYNLVRQFTTPDEPKVSDYPKGKYYAYWEILVDEIPGGYSALVRFYRIGEPGLLYEKQIINPYLTEVKRQVNELIRTQMETYKR